MKNVITLMTALAVTTAVAAPLAAQTRVTGVENLNDRIDDITDDVQTDMARGDDADRFGPNGVPQGWRGSFALTASGSDGNTESGELSAAGRLTYGAGPWNHLFGLALEYGEANGVKNEERFFATYEANRYFSEQFYVFGLGRYEYDGFDALGTPGAEKDAFLGFGPGYRVINTRQQTWRVQGGPGVRYYEDVLGNDETELAGILSSRYFYAVSDTVAFTNDTDLLGSDENTVITNDAGFNFKVSQNLATRLSLRTDYNSDPVAGRESTDNTLGVSLVLGF